MDIKTLLDMVDKLRKNILFRICSSAELGSFFDEFLGDDIDVKMDFGELTRLQKKWLKAVEKCCTELMSRAENDNICLFLTGSLTRLEFLPGISDLDFMAVNAGVGGDESWRELEDENDLAVAHDEIRRFEKFMADLKNEFMRIAAPIKNDLVFKHIFKNDLINLENLIDLGGQPLASKVTFFNKKDLFSRLGEKKEPAWASWARAVILCESASWGKPTFVKELTDKSAETNHIRKDFLMKRFPGMGCCLSEYLADSGLIAKLGFLGKDSMDIPIKTRGSGGDDHPDKIKKADAELLKAFFSRKMISVINRMMLHVLYWGTFLEEAPWSSYDEIIEWINAPPLIKLTDHLPSVFKVVFERRFELVCSISKDHVITEKNNYKNDFILNIEILNDLLEIGGPGHNNVIPLFYCFTRLMGYCHSIRLGEVFIDSNTIMALSRINLMWESSLNICKKITRYFLPYFGDSHGPHRYEVLATHFGGESPFYEMPS